jgi:hypothetical protein
MITTLITHGIALVVGGVVGLLVGRKNPKVADLAQQAADKTAASVDKLKS